MKSLITLALVFSASVSFAAGGAFQIYNNKLSFPDGSEFSTAPKDGKTIYNGSGPPTEAATTDDFYLDTKNNVLYGPYNGSSWGTGISLVGPRGLKGEKGDPGPPAVIPTLYKPVDFKVLTNDWQLNLSPTATNTTVMTSGDYIVPDGVTYVTIEAIGGAGGGGASGYAGGGPGAGGGSGEYAGTYLLVTPGSTISIIYGEAGAGGIQDNPVGNATGGNGGDTLVTYNKIVYVTAHGGHGGCYAAAGDLMNSYPGGVGGTGSSDMQHIDGTNGSNSNPMDFYGASGGTGAGHFSPNIGGKGGDYNFNWSPGSPGTPGAVAISYM